MFDCSFTFLQPYQNRWRNKTWYVQICFQLIFCKIYISRVAKLLHCWSFFKMNLCSQLSWRNLYTNEVFFCFGSNVWYTNGIQKLKLVNGDVKVLYFLYPSLVFIIQLVSQRQKVIIMWSNSNDWYVENFQKSQQGSK